MEKKCGNCQKNTIANMTAAPQSNRPRAAAHPSTPGMAPGNAPTNVQMGCTFFNGVYAAKYTAAVATESQPVRAFITNPR